MSFAALTASPGARAHFDRRRAAGDRHIAAQRNLFNRMLGVLHHCLTTRQKYDDVPVGWPRGKFGTIQRRPATEAIHWNHW